VGVIKAAHPTTPSGFAREERSSPSSGRILFLAQMRVKAQAEVGCCVKSRLTPPKRKCDLVDTVALACPGPVGQPLATVIPPTKRGALDLPTRRGSQSGIKGAPWRTEATNSRNMARNTNHPSFSVSCPNCESTVEHSLTWLKGREEFEFYCDSCGHRDNITAATVPGLPEALNNLDR
jgi:hypothetical protein